ncbi:TPA: type VI secretion system lipoprotein TssJ [Vibrio vulnificus]|uniref:Type VI secretion system lipoprotein TssJ n=1 Tax=Vibrio vulnificus TaxID=672 RepID=A0A2S3R3K0_VIBVL|nr:type VI secretion system lipoprotein TssJ [Vibrio vulnificus]ELP6755699.1 type VI secretion system lipoprotein TssJ [Vibrio vulnificus]MDK2620486.1 type VI secretion system lipoprotein TssJ [Vibrio vulnificus]POB48265.1 type VI secretion system lipoprotein TssJ [Vibrio vulnificus]RAH30753.1 type VI secretion system lipoprotein TssJ [Vibrio vulnificus]HDY7619932.1 type VI secretion system lipoprotein TssJ [Vibrio vulnificus]
MNKALWMVFAFMVLTACSSSGKYEPAKEPTKITLSLVSAEEVNPNIWGEASPIEIQVFELADDSMFMSSDYDQMKNDYKKVLRSNFIKNYDYVLTPGQFKFVNAFEVDADTNYIGIMAHFAEPELSEWKKVVKVLNKGREYHLLMLFKDYDVKLDKVE